MASPLTLLMPVIPGTSLTTIAATLQKYQPKLDAALASIGTVHYARTLLVAGCIHCQSATRRRDR